MWWSDWYDQASGAVSGAVSSAQSTVSALFREPQVGSGAYEPDDPAALRIIQERRSGTPYDLFPVNPGPMPVATDIQQQILARPKTWDEMSFWEKAYAYAGIAPGAVADTVGLSGRAGSETPATAATSAGKAAAAGVQSVGETVGGLVNTTVSGALGLGKGGLGGLLGSTLTKVILALVVIVVGLYFVARIKG